MISRYAPPGMREFSGREPIGKRLHLDKLRNYGADKNFPDDENLKGKLFADAMIEAVVWRLMERAHAETQPRSTQTFLPVHEFQNGLVPFVGETDAARRNRVALFTSLTLDGRVSTIDAALRELLGDKLAFYRTRRLNELTSWDRDADDRPHRNYPGRSTPIRVMRTVAGVAKIGEPLIIPVEFVGGDPEPYTVGQVVMADGGSNARAERITIEAITDTTITATFQFPHDTGTTLTSAHFPRASSSKRMHHIVLNDEWALDPNTRAEINQLMHRLIKGPAIWQIQQAVTASTAGPFIIGTSPIGVTPFDEVPS
jgi:hypothetical protein